MIDKKMTRRDMLRLSGMTIAASGLTTVISCTSKTNDPDKERKRPFRISLNTSTIRGYKLPVEEQIDLCGEAGFEGVELWVSDVEAYVKQGGVPEDLAKQMKSHGLLLENMIAFSTWAADEPDLREEGIRKMRQDMELTARLGGKYIAAPVQGIQSIEKEKMEEYASRYRQILLTGDDTGVIPIIELWGAGVLNKLSDAAFIAIATAHPKAAMLLDFYHLYRGGNSFESLRLVNGAALPVFHINDYPAQPERTNLKDDDRVFPGDGICPFNEVLPILFNSGFRGGFSVELFNQRYWDTMDVKAVLEQSFDKTLRIIQRAGF